LKTLSAILHFLLRAKVRTLTHQNINLWCVVWNIRNA